jgi:signal transduction histidine kinase
VSAIRSQVDVLSAVTEEYLRFARLPKPKLEVATVTPVIEDLADFVREELRARKVELVVNVPAGQPRLRLDPGQIRQALLNLIRNAVEAMPEGGTIHIAARRVKLSNGQLVDTSRPIDDLTTRPIDKGDFIEIEVRDIGTGIPPGNLEKIFEPFFTNKEGGTGLGLAIARQIAVDHGGNLACESTRGVGTTFRLTLPIPDGERVP